MKGPWVLRNNMCFAAPDSQHQSVAEPLFCGVSLWCPKEIVCKPFEAECSLDSDHSTCEHFARVAHGALFGTRGLSRRDSNDMDGS